MERMEEERLVKKIVRSDATGVRSKGRPRMGWIDVVKKALDARGMTVKKGSMVVRDRSDWEAVINA